jgi:beta-galactosidase GanA
MKRHPHLRFAFLLATSVLVGAGQVRVLDDFETPASIQRWEGPLLISRARAVHGVSSGRLSFTAGHARFSSRQMNNDWSGFDRLAFDVYSDSDEPKALSLAIYDAVGGDLGKAAKYDYFDANRKLLLLKGWNHIEVSLRHLRASNTIRDIDLRRVVRLVLSAGQGALPLTVDLDNMRLISGTENAATMSRTSAADALTTIDDRWFSVRQVADPEDVPESSVVRELRRVAERESDSLRSAIRAAQMQGLETIYSERRLVVADLGLHVRPLLAWFNTDAQKARMFQYVAMSCREERKALERQLNAATRLDEVDDTQGGEPPIPPIPVLRGAPAAGWFFRDEAGRPLMVISLHSPSVALQRFFATPLQHIESYSVGGGSRWTIEDSPVYEAFQKNPDAHRVGWDGWCGHLVKDLDSMGGTKRENVVICLESRHIRKAIEEYIRLTIPKLRSNPNLLYNILAYELTYICYCDESRRMFAHWLRDKHGSIAKANESWGTSYAAFEDVIPPPTQNSRPLPSTNRALWYDWARFNQDRFTEHLLWVRDTVRKYDPSTPLAAGGSSSMLSGRAGVAGIDEERIVNEVDDVIIHEGGGSTMGLDLQVALSEHPKPVADPEMSLGSVSNLLPHLLHGKSVVQLFHWPAQPSSEFVSNIRSSLAHSWEYGLEKIDDLLKTTLDARRLRVEIAAFVEHPPRVAILYSQTSTLQIPPAMFSWERTPYLYELERTYTASRFLDVKTTFVTERQIDHGKLAGFPLLLIPGAQALPAGIAEKIRDYVAAGGRVVATPGSLTVDEYNRPREYLAAFGIRLTGTQSAKAIVSGEQVQRYDQTFSESVSFAPGPGIVTTAAPGGRFSSLQQLLVEANREQVKLSGAAEPLFRYPDGSASLVAARFGKGTVYYSAGRLKEQDYARLLDRIFTEAGVVRETRVVVEPAPGWKVESRAATLHGRRLQYVTNYNAIPITAHIQDDHGRFQRLRELRSGRDYPEGSIRIAAGETVICEIKE